jgi:predicted RNase H-like nuclease
MRSLGIDLAAEPPNTAACEITWTANKAHGRLYTDRLDDHQLVTLIETADKVGIDCPFGWPQPFVDAVAAHANAAAWPGRGQLGSSHRRSLRYRLTDEIVHQHIGIWPLSVSTDRIGVTAMRCAALLDALAAAGHPVDRAGGGQVVEVYPAAALKHWGLPHQGYKKAEGAIVRGQALDQLLAMLPTLILDRDAMNRCRHSDDAFDALICALVARAAGLGRTTRPCPGDQTERAHVEGWIHLPTSDIPGLQLPDLDAQRRAVDSGSSRTEPYG